MLVATLKCCDLFIGMMVGYYSDNCKSKYGRRKPFIAIGAPFWCPQPTAALSALPHRRGWGSGEGRFRNSFLRGCLRNSRSCTLRNHSAALPDGAPTAILISGLPCS